MVSCRGRHEPNIANSWGHKSATISVIDMKFNASRHATRPCRPLGYGVQRSTATEGVRFADKLDYHAEGTKGHVYVEINSGIQRMRVLRNVRGCMMPQCIIVHVNRDQTGKVSYIIYYPHVYSIITFVSEIERGAS